MQLLLEFAQLGVALFAVGSATGLLLRHFAGAIHRALDHHAGQGAACEGGILAIGPANRCTDGQILRRGYQDDLGPTFTSISWIGAG